MISQAFISGAEYQEFKTILKDMVENKPINLKTDGKTNEMIAREVTAYEIAAKTLDKAFRKFESQVNRPIKEEQKYI